MRLIATLALVVGCWLPTTASAQPTAPDDSLTEAERAVEIGRTAISLFKEQRWSAAYDKFSEAEQVAHSPVFLLYMARSKHQLGELLAARALYQRVVDDQLPASAPDPWRSAQEEGAREKKALEQLVPTLRIVVRGGESVVVKLDGRTLSAAEVGQPVELDPGEHVIEAVSRGQKPVVEKVKIEPGTRRDVSLVLGQGPAQSPSPSPEPTPGKPIETASEGLVVPGAVLLAVAGAAAIVGGVTGGLALAKAGEVSDGCTGDDCTAGGQAAVDDRESALTLAHVSTAALVVAGVAAAVGITLVILKPGGTEVRAGPASLALRVAF